MKQQPKQPERRVRAWAVQRTDGAACAVFASEAMATEYRYICIVAHPALASLMSINRVLVPASVFEGRGKP